MNEGFWLLLAAALGNSPAAVSGGKQVPPREVAVVSTSLGSFEIELFRSDAPKTVENFVALAEKKFFDGLRVHRIARGFVIQTGDPLTRDPNAVGRWGRGGESIFGGEFADELDPNTPSGRAGYRRGVVAMANHGPNTNTSQFFVLLADAPWLPRSYTIFGRVVAGMETVASIGAVELDPPKAQDGRPKSDVMVTSIRIVRKTAPARPAGSEGAK
jgi:cyclophilin family peptidyl-prolyl cis-trans isomerase